MYDGFGSVMNCVETGFVNQLSHPSDDGGECPIFRSGPTHFVLFDSIRITREGAILSLPLNKLRINEILKKNNWSYIIAIELFSGL